MGFSYNNTGGLFSYYSSLINNSFTTLLNKQQQKTTFQRGTYKGKAKRKLAMLVTTEINMKLCMNFVVYNFRPTGNVGFRIKDTLKTYLVSLLYLDGVL